MAIGEEGSDEEDHPASGDTFGGEEPSVLDRRVAGAVAGLVGLVVVVVADLRWFLVLQMVLPDSGAVLVAEPLVSLESACLRVGRAALACVGSFGGKRCD